MALVLFCRHSSHLQHLERENEWLRMQMVHERQRAEVAIDRLLNLKLGVPGVTHATREELREFESEIEKTVRDPEFTQAGEV